jgi:orotate phosphoribosyltransferase
MTREQLAKRIYAISHLTGQFRLRSGQTSTEYFDKYRFESEPALLQPLTEHLAELLPSSTEVLAGLELGGVPLATALALKTGLPVAFVRKAAKDYGTCQIVEGQDLSDRYVCVVEDVVSTGGQILESTAELRKLGAKIDTVLCVINRAGKTPESFSKVGLKLNSLFTMDELKTHA